MNYFLLLIEPAPLTGRLSNVLGYVSLFLPQGEVSEYTVKQFCAFVFTSLMIGITLGNEKKTHYTINRTMTASAIYRSNLITKCRPEGSFDMLPVASLNFENFNRWKNAAIPGIFIRFTKHFSVECAENNSFVLEVIDRKK